MEDRINRFCERVVRSPLPICLRRGFMYAIFFVNFVLYVYTCGQIWSHSKTHLKNNNTDLSSNFTDIIEDLTITTNYSSILTSSGSNQSLFVYQMNQSNTSTSLTPDDITNTSDEITLSRLYGYAIAIPFVIFAFLICICACRIRYQSLYAYSVQYGNFINTIKVGDYRRLRSDYRQKVKKLVDNEEYTLKTILTLKEQSSIFAFCRTCVYWKPTISFTSLTYPMIDCTLVDYMFMSLHYEGGYQILGAIELIHEVMKAMDYLHYRNVYHLDLRPESVKLHCNGRKVYLKLTNFNFMRKSVNKRISSTSVGVQGFYRPLECSVDQEVDSEKCDIWGLGLIALDLFTGGLYRIKSESGDWSEQNREELLSTFIQYRSFGSYVEAAYGIVDMFLFARYRSSSVIEMRWTEDQLGFAIVTEYPYKTYKVCHTNFFHNIKNFVFRLLTFNPRRRITLKRAFDEPLMVNRQFKSKK